MKNTFKFHAFISFTLLLWISSACDMNDRYESNLSAKDLEFIQKTCNLNKDETIILFETNAGFKGYKQGGNFITNKRVATYWIEDNNKTVESAYYHEIDSILLNNKTGAVTLASSLVIYKNDGLSFELFVDADSTRLYDFYNKTIEVWQQEKNNP